VYLVDLRRGLIYLVAAVTTISGFQYSFSTARKLST
jgi:hypothetical protein